MKINIVIFAVGIDLFYNQCKLLITSLINNLLEKNFLIHIFTDNDCWIPEEYAKFSKVNILSKSQIEDYKGKYQFIHRVKIVIIEKVSKEFGDYILYIDSDCFLKSDFRIIFSRIPENCFVMHKKEFDFNDNYIHLSPLKSLVGIFENSSLKYALKHSSFSMWNAGVIGGLSSQLIPLFEHIYQMTDLIYKYTQLHTSEQLAFSIVLQTNAPVFAADDFIYHYWDKPEKLFMNKFISKILPKHGNANSNINFKKLPYFIKNSYDVFKYNTIHSLECNRFLVGYKYAYLSFVKNPKLDNELRGSLYFHFNRHIKHLIKKILGRI
ncbi:hypothetical protein [Runella aurantiaca]|uniref:Glycosyl transferase family 8 n=1 Tax=Runella aurantiaca TaxID=2282308 RepID=A0A369I3G7_9BACT|nr:hypothetical protein [Runella aurantiaca]RDB04341.1 hypothetical protein DVG78_19280 [Runella aurantiaca]